MERIYVALDLEFTGLDPRRDEIIEVGMVRFRGEQVLETFTSLVGAQRSLPLKIQQLVGISQADLEKAPPLSALTGRMLSFLKNYPLVAHTIGTDLQYLSRQGVPLGNLAIDTFELAAILVPEAQRYSLASLAQTLGIELPHNHRALADAMATKDLFLALTERARHWDLALLEEITRLAEGTDWSLRQVFRDILEEKRSRSGSAEQSPWARGKVVGEDSPRPVGTTADMLAVDGFEPLEPTTSTKPLDAEALAELVSPGGLLQRALPGYEHRPQQVDMLRAVADAFNLPCHLMVEAGTGTGKSVAYLLPAIHFAVENGRRVVVSSNTINLQDQLYNKDLPDLQRILPLRFQVALLKGRSNYLCLRRLASFRRSRALTVDEVRVLAKIVAWLPMTKTGDRTELLLLGQELAIWSGIQADAENCLGDLCPHLQRGRCFFYRARARAERAHLVIVNHALLLADLALDNRVLPEYKHLIIDEAHHLEEQATAQFGLQVSRRDVYAFLEALSHTDGGAPGGLLARVPGLLQGDGVSEPLRQSVGAINQVLAESIDRAERQLYELFNTLARFLRGQAPSRPAAQESYDQHVSLTPGLRAQPDWSNVEIAWEGFAEPMRRVLHELQRLQLQLEGLTLGESTERDELVQELIAQMQRGNEMWAGMGRLLAKPTPQEIYWLSIGRADGEITVCSAPLHVGTLLRERLFAHTDCVVLTSATLRTAGSFRFLQDRLGLEEPATLAVDSPFNFRTAVLLYVPNDVPEPSEPYYQRTVEKALIELAQSTEGRMLVLFTSTSQLNATYRAIQGPLEREDIVVFAQGMDGSRRQILESFRSTPRSVLLGTRSFWEGVDVVGQALSCLVIARLPFAVPTDPVMSARAATFDDPFNDFYLPDSILRFRQGFGRLIRSKDDFGLVVVLDKRILTKPYGRTILRSLPPCTARQGPLQSLPTLARRWLDPANHS